MRFLLMHKTDTRWEAGEVPPMALIERVGKLIGEMSAEGVLLAGEGLRASALGVRVTRSGGVTRRQPGPFEGRNELLASFTILQVASFDEAVEIAERQAEALGDGAEIDVRPVTEGWDIGLMARPDGLTTQRVMALRKATRETEAGVRPAAMGTIAGAATVLAEEAIAPSRRGRRFKNTGDGVRVLDGPFAESKELIAGYVMFRAASLDDAARWAAPYLGVVEAQEVDLLELLELP